MSREIEIEFKNLLTKQEFGKLFQYFGLENKPFTLQHNHYFDTRDFMLKEQNCALRIREKNGHYTLTMKQPQPVGLLEIHQKLTKQDYERIKTQNMFPDGEVTKELLEMNASPATLVHFGNLSTKRVETGYQEGLLVLDHSCYLGTEDYELEYECLDEASGEKIFFELLERFQIPKRKTENKIRRLYNMKK